MKTLQEQYNKIQEGKGSKEIFMKDAKRQFPNLVRNAAGFNETANALKGRGIISEAVFVSTGNTQKPDWFSIFNDNMSSLTEEAKAVEKKVSKEVEDLQEKGYDYKDLKNVDNVFGESFLRGYYTEMKDPANKDKTIDEVKDIVAKNLAKDRLYYTKEAQFGCKGIGYTDEHPGLTASKTDQMEKVKIKEDIIKEHIMIKLTDILAEASDKPKRAKKAKKETTESKLKAIEEQGRITTLEAQIDALEEIIEAKTSRITMVQEDENMAELVAPAKVKEMQREVKKLEKLKEKYGRMYEKACGKSYEGKTVLATEDTLEEDSIEEDFLDEASNDNSNLNSDQGSNSNSNTNPESYSGLDRFKRK